MKIILASLLAVMMCCGTAFAQYEQYENAMGVFFDVEGVFNYKDLSFTGASIPLTAYLVLVRPTAPQVQSWEARIESDVSALGVGEWVVNGGVNSALVPDFIVDYGPAPFPTQPCESLILAHREILFFMVTGEHATFVVSGVPGSPNFDDGPGYFAEPGWAVPGYWSSIWSDARGGIYDGDDSPFSRSMLRDYQRYDANGEPISCHLGEPLQLSYCRVVTAQDLLGDLSYHVREYTGGIRVMDSVPRSLEVGAMIHVSGTPELLDGEVVLLDVSFFYSNPSNIAQTIPQVCSLAALASAYDHVGGFVRLYGEVVSTDAAGLVLTDAGATLRVEIPASLGVDPLAYQPGQVLTVSGIFSIMNGRHLIVRDAAEIVEGNVANERRTMGGVKALFR